jgi:hypothetical protein
MSEGRLQGLAHVPAQLDCRYSRHLRINTKDLVPVRISRATHIRPINLGTSAGTGIVLMVV